MEQIAKQIIESEVGQSIRRLLYIYHMIILAMLEQK